MAAANGESQPGAMAITTVMNERLIVGSSVPNIDQCPYDQPCTDQRVYSTNGTNWNVHCGSGYGRGESLGFTDGVASIYACIDMCNDTKGCGVAEFYRPDLGRCYLRRNGGVQKVCQCQYDTAIRYRHEIPQK